MNTTETLELLAQFGRRIEQSPVVVPAFNNYFQDMNGGGSLLGNLTLLNGERMFDHDNQDAQYPDFEFKWYADGIFKAETPNPIINELKPDGYDGVFKVKLEVLHKPTNTIYTREKWSFFDWNDEPNTLEGGDRPNRWEVFYTFYPEGIHFGRLKYDYDGDGLVSTSDLLAFIGGEEVQRGITIKKDSTTKYDWTDVPDEVGWIATSDDGRIEPWARKPKADVKLSWWGLKNPKKKADFGYGWLKRLTLPNTVKPYSGDWKDSLEKRP